MPQASDAPTPTATGERETASQVSKTVGLEEHFVVPEVLEAWRALDPALRDLSLQLSSTGDTGRRLLGFADDRLAAMDATGLDVAVLSLTAPGVQSLAAADAVALQRESNDRLADAVRARPERYQGFATLATPAPAAAASELERAVTKLGFQGAMLFGRTRDRNLDAPEFEPIFEAAAALRAPLYLHPQSPQPAVRAAYYSGFGDPLDAMFATYGVGWHYETGVQLLRLILGGVFDRYPNLQVIVGHWGELVLFYLERIEDMARAAKLPRSLAEYVRDNVLVTPAGIYSRRYLRWAIEVVGVERILFSTDYPYVPGSMHGGRGFLDAAELADADRESIGHGNWDRLCAAIRR